MRVVIESPFSGDQKKNINYAQDCLRDSLARGESPIASHLIYPQVLDDAKDTEREQGINAGLEWGSCAELVAVYTNLGISLGMAKAIAHYAGSGLRVEFRSLSDGSSYGFADV